MLRRLLPASARGRAVAFLGGVAIVVAAWAVVDLIRIQRDIASGQGILKSAKATDLARSGGIGEIAARARARFDRADRIARRGPPFRLARPIPYVGQHVAVLRSLTATAARVGAVGARAASAVQARLDDATKGPAGRVTLLNTAITEVDRARADIAKLRVRRTALLLPPLRGARASLLSSLQSAQRRLRDVSSMAGGLRRMLVGPSRYVILAGNNAEMRAGGMPLSAGVAEIANGEFKLNKFTPTGNLLLHNPRVPVPESLEKLYGWMYIGGEWRATTATPNFPLSARMYEQMAPRAGLGKVDGVIFVDVLALRAVVAATGPIDLAGFRYTTDNIAKELMNDNYLRFGDPVEQEGRYDLQSQLGVAVFNALDSRPLKLGKLVSNLSAAGKGRHLLAWSADPALNKAWRRARISGELNANGLMVNMQNISANKLDWYIKPRLSLRTLYKRGNERRVELTLTFSNNKRSPTSDYVEGIKYARKNGMADGEHRVYLVVYLPRSTFNIAADDPPFDTVGIDGGLKVVGFRYGVKVGESRTVKITFSVPKKQVFSVIPSARAHPLVINTPDHRYTDEVPTVIKL